MILYLSTKAHVSKLMVENSKQSKLKTSPLTYHLRQFKTPHTK